MTKKIILTIMIFSSIFMLNEVNVKSVDLEDYTYKTWYAVDDSGNKFFFSLDKITDDYVIGTYNAYGFIAAVSSENPITLNGHIENDTIICELNENTGNGMLKLSGFSENQITGELYYDYNLQDRYFENGKYIFQPYSITNINSKVVDEDSDFTYINGFGKNKTVSIEVIHSKVAEINTYMVNEENVVIYQFYPNIPSGMNIIEKAYEDVNNDGLKDFVILYQSIDEYWSKKILGGIVYIQNDSKQFEKDSARTLEIESYGVEVLENNYNQFDIEHILNILN